MLLGLSIGTICYGFYYAAVESSSEHGASQISLTVGLGLLVVLCGLILLAIALFSAYLIECFYRGYIYLKDREALKRRSERLGGASQRCDTASLKKTVTNVTRKQRASSFDSANYAMLADYIVTLTHSS